MRGRTANPNVCSPAARGVGHRRGASPFPLVSGPALLGSARRNHPSRTQGIQRGHTMTTTHAGVLQRSDLNAFLFADVGVEANGMVLSVLSTLARRGVDPWQEAGRLAKLPRAAAIDGLARIIAAMPASPWSLQDAMTIAAPLVLLLPKHSPTDPVPTPETKTEFLTARRWGSPWFCWAPSSRVSCPTAQDQQDRQHLPAKPATWAAESRLPKRSGPSWSRCCEPHMLYVQEHHYARSPLVEGR
jgi:hypothetical protein